MGSSGFGTFGNYDITNKGSISPNGQNGGIGGGNFPDPLEYIRLEDVAISEYYMNYQSLPAQGESVELATRIIHGRLAVLDGGTGEVLGNLPTRYNYLLRNIQLGTLFTGIVVSSGEIPVPFVVVTLNA